MMSLPCLYLLILLSVSSRFVRGYNVLDPIKDLDQKTEITGIPMQPIVPELCKFSERLVLKSKRSIIGIDQYSNNDIILSFDNGHALIYEIPELLNQGSFKKQVKLAPSNPEPWHFRERCKAGYPLHPLHHEKPCFDTMRISVCPQDGKTVLYDYHIVDEKSPQISYGPNNLLKQGRSKDSKWYCQIYPQRHQHPETLKHSPNIAVSGSSYFDKSFGNLIFMMDLESNSILIHIGSTKEDCVNILSRHHVYQGKIISMASCCDLPLLFVGIDNGQVLIFYFQYMGKLRDRGRLVFLDAIASPCPCSCLDGTILPIQISVCCQKSCIEECKIGLKVLSISILYQQRYECSMSNFISSFKYHFVYDIKTEQFSIEAKYPLPHIRNAAIIMDFKICCNCGFVFLLLRSDNGCIFLMKYDLLTGKFLDKFELPTGFSIKSWIVLQSDPKNSWDCCALFVFSKFERDSCEPCSFVIAYCCKAFSLPKNK